jgi:hypothetical protein
LASFELASSRLKAAIDAVNDDLARHARAAAANVEAFPEQGVTGIRLSGSLVPFYDQEAERLAASRGSAAERPWEALGTIARAVENRLSEPAEGFELEDSSRRQELTRFLREIEDTLEDSEARAETALAAFRSDAAAAARAAGGPFYRRGVGRIFEIILASVLGALLAEALRRSYRLVPGLLAAAFAPVLATSVVLLLEGTPILTVDPIRGLTLAFLPLSFAIGLASAELLAILARFPKLLEPEADVRRARLEYPLSSSSTASPAPPAPQPETFRERPPEARPTPPAAPLAPRPEFHQPEPVLRNGEPARSEIELDEARPLREEPPLERSQSAAAEVPFFQKRKGS